MILVMETLYHAVRNYLNMHQCISVYVSLTLNKLWEFLMM